MRRFVLILLLSAANAWHVVGRRAAAAVIASSITLLRSPLGAPERAVAFVAGKDEEVSGLVVLRIAEVCQFQEKLLRQLAACSSGGKRKSRAADQFGNAYCEGNAYSVNPVQISFGTGLMLRNSNLDGNLRLMIRTEVPREQRGEAARSAAAIMNTINKLGAAVETYGTSFTDEGMLEVADVYADARRQLARFFDYLPQASKDRFYNYNIQVRDYETKELETEGIERMKL